MSNPWRLFILQSRREYLCQLRQPKLLLYAAVFFLMIIVFFPLTITPSPDRLRNIAPGLTWMALLLAQLLTSDRLFGQDYDEGVIEQWLCCGEPLGILIAAKLMIYWLITLIPLLLCCPIIAVLFGLTSRELLVMMLGLVLGSPATMFVCALASSFSSGLQQKGVVVALILLPLTIPVLIFGSGSLSLFLQGHAVNAYFAILLALSVLAVSCLPVAIGAIIRISLAE